MPHSEPTFASGWRASVILVTLGVIAALYLGRAILIPVALAILLTFLLAPVVARLEALIGSRAVAVGAVAGLAIGLGVGVGFLVGNQFLGLAEKLPEYRTTLLAKVRSVRAGAERAVSNASETINAVGDELSGQPRDGSNPAPDGHSQAQTAPAPAAPTVVSTGMSYLSSLAMPAIEFFASTAIVIVLFVLMLASRQDIRDRVIRLAGLSNIGITTQALEDAGARIGRYLGANLFINAVYGVGVTLGLWALSVPNAAMCGLMAGILRFVPMLGSWLGAVIPIILSIVVFDDWWHLALVVTLIVVLEAANNIVLEPWLYGNSTGLSSLGIVLSVVFWTWVWGPIGLVLAVPVTVCLVVLSRQIPQLGALAVLLGDEQVLTNSLRFYQRALCSNESDAAAILAAAPEDADPAEVLDDILIPSLAAARLDLTRGLISASQGDRIARLTQELGVDWIEDRVPTAAGVLPPPQPALCVPATDEFDGCAGALLAAILTRRGVPTTAPSSQLLLSETLAAAQDSGVTVVILSCLQPVSPVHIRRLCKSIRQRMPAARIVVGSWGEADTDTSTPDTLADARVRTLKQASATVMSLSTTQESAEPAPDPVASR